MEQLNYTLFLFINAPTRPSGMTGLAAHFAADVLIYLVPVCLIFLWGRVGDIARRAAFDAAIATVLALGIAQVCGILWPHPRPFMVPLGHQWAAHIADASFPSDHLTVTWSVAICLLAQPTTRRTGAVLAVLGLPIAWARIYLGVHFPLDMLGAAMVAAGSVGLVKIAAGPLGSLYALALRLYGVLCQRLILRGWLLA